MGESEVAAGTVNVKDIAAASEVPVPRTALVEHLRALLAATGRAPTAVAAAASGGAADAVRMAQPAMTRDCRLSLTHARTLTLSLSDSHSLTMPALASSDNVSTSRCQVSPSCL